MRQLYLQRTVLHLLKAVCRQPLMYDLPLRMMDRYPQFKTMGCLMSLKQDANVQGPLYLNEQLLALADVLVLQGQTQSVHLHDAPRMIPQTICPSIYVTTLYVLGKVRLPAMTKHKHPLLCAVELGSLRLWLIVFLRKNRLSISVSSRTFQVIWTTVGSPRLSNLI